MLVEAGSKPATASALRTERAGLFGLLREVATLAATLTETTETALIRRPERRRDTQCQRYAGREFAKSKPPPEG